MSCLIIFRSVTYAQSAERKLTRHGINAHLSRPPAGIAGGSCSYSLKIKDQDAPKAKQIIRQSKIPIVKIYEQTSNESYREVTL